MREIIDEYGSALIVAILMSACLGGFGQILKMVLAGSF